MEIFIVHFHVAAHQREHEVVDGLLCRALALVDRGDQEDGLGGAGRGHAQEVGQRLPDWRLQRQWLRSHGGMLKRQLGVLLEAR